VSHAPAAGSAAVDVFRIPLDAGEAALARAAALLSADERERAARFHFARDARRFVLARGAVRAILAREVGLSAEALAFVYGPHGKPALAGGAEPRFSVSHSEDLALVAVARGREVGVDLERVRRAYDDALAETAFSDLELAALRALPPEERAAAFHRGWTRKEAYLKARGEGFARPLGSFDVSLGREAPRLLATRPDARDAGRWSLADIDLGPGWAAALALEGARAEPRLRELQSDAAA
jgi:4'-phosphopantetheinyl transferase